MIGLGTSGAPALGDDPRLDGEEAEQILQIETLLEDLRQREEHPLGQVPALPEGGRQEGQNADRERARRPAVSNHGEIDDHRIRRVVAERPHDGEERGDQAPADGQILVGVVEFLREAVVSIHQKVREPEELELLGRDVAGADVAEIVELPPLRRPRVEQGIAERGEVGLAEERGEHRHHEQDEEPGHVYRDGGAEGGERDSILHRREEQGEEPDPSHRLPPRPLQLVVHLGVLELLQVERGRVAHQLDAGSIREQVAEQALEQRREPGQPLADQCDDELDGEELDESFPVHWRARAGQTHRMHDFVHDELADPEHGERNERAGDPEEENRQDVARLGGPYQLEQSRDVLHGLEALAPSRSRLVSLSAGTVRSYYRMPEG